METADQPEEITLWQESGTDADWWVIRHEPTGVTTQGHSKLHALLMLADALAGYTDADENLYDLAYDVFVPDDEMRALADDLAGRDN